MSGLKTAILAILRLVYYYNFIIKHMYYVTSIRVIQMTGLYQMNTDTCMMLKLHVAKDKRQETARCSSMLNELVFAYCSH